MKQIIYHSRPFGFDEAMLSGILLQARRNNARDGITGALICRQELYLQLLEGPEQAIDRLYAKIAQDDRHADVQVAYAAMVEARMFPGWEMLDDSMPGVTFSCEGIASGAIEAATVDELRGVFALLAERAKG